MSSVSPLLCLLTNITSLSLEGNALEQLPNEFTRLSSLTLLNLANNKLHSLQWDKTAAMREEQPLPTFAIFPSLTQLDLSANPFKKLPNLSASCPGLTSLNLTRTQQKNIPFWINALTSLNTLRVKGNWIRDISFSLCDAHSLVALDLSQNQLYSLPLPFTRLTKLSSLELEGNNLAYSGSIAHVFDQIVKDKNSLLIQKRYLKSTPSLPLTF